MAFWNACSGVLTFLCIGLLGYILARRGLVTPEITAMLPRFLTTIVLPPYLLRTVTTTFSHDQLIHLVYGALLPLASILVVFLVAVLLCRLLAVREGRKGILCTAIATSNTLNIGLPINIALFGESAVSYVLLYFFANTLFFWTIGNYAIARDGPGKAPRILSPGTLKNVCSPPLIGFVCGILLTIGEIPLPSFLDKALQYVGSMTIALALIYVGILVSDIKLKDCRLEKDILCVLIGRFILSPLIIIVLASFIEIPVLMRNVFIIQSSLPVMMNAVIIAGHYRADLQFATVAISISTMISLVTIPVFMVLIASLM